MITQLSKMIHNKYDEIMKQFLRDYGREIYGRELVKKVNISQKNIALTLEELEKTRILSSKTRGNMRYFFLNKSNLLYKKYLLLAEVENSIEFFKNNSKVGHILNKINKDGKIICVFGSYAKGIQKKSSDLDLFIVGKFDEKVIQMVGRDYNLEINIQGGSMSDFVSSLKGKDSLMNEILENHILISGYEKFIEEVVRWRV